MLAGMRTSEFFSYLLRHEASQDLAVDLADAFLDRLRTQKAGIAATAPVTARAS
jgi:hypothetical protein